MSGQEILVGSSSRTNRAGIESLQRTFPEIPVTSIPIHGTLHLKSVATLAEADLLVIGGSSAAQSILQVNTLFTLNLSHLRAPYFSNKFVREVLIDQHISAHCTFSSLKPELNIGGHCAQLYTF